LVAEHIRSKSNGQTTLDAIERDRLLEGYTPATRVLLGTASRIRGSGWFKSVTTFQEVAREIVGPHLGTSEAGFSAVINQLWNWTRAA